MEIPSSKKKKNSTNGDIDEQNISSVLRTSASRINQKSRASDPPPSLKDAVFDKNVQIRFSEKEKREQQDLIQKLEQSKREKDLRDHQDRELESDSDSDREKEKNKDKKKEDKKKHMETKNLKRKRDRENIIKLSDNSVSTEMTDEELFRNNENNLAIPTDIRSRVPEDVLSIYHETLSLDELNHLDDKELQDEDQRNTPLPIQRYFYMQRETRNEMRKKYGSNQLASDTASFEEHISKFNASEKDMSAILDKVKRDRKMSSSKNPEKFRVNLMKVVNEVSREVDDLFLVTPIPGTQERPCIKGEECEGRKIPGAVPVTLKERLSEQVIASGKLPESVGMCLMCLREAELFMFVNTRAETGTIPHKNVLISGTASITDKEREYPRTYTVSSSSLNFQGISCPLVIHVRTNYRQYYDDKMGCYGYKQDGIPYPEDLARANFQ